MPFRTLWLLIISLAAVGTGCSDPPSDGDADSDTDQDGDQDDDWDLDIEPPTPPAPPVLTPCPEGWVEVPPEDPTDPYDVATCDPWPEDGPAKLTPCPAGWREIPRTEPGGVATCDPWPEGGMQECEGAEAHFPGEPGCRRIGSECPAGDWADGLPETGVIYVRAGAPFGGAGTRASPFGTIAEATAGATDGTTIALSKGTFDEAVVLPAGVTLWGACVRDTVVAWSGAAETDATITAQAAGSSVRDLTVGGEGQGVLVEGEEAALGVEGVLVSGARRAGVFVRDGATLTGSDLVVRETRGTSEPDPEVPEYDATRGHGLWVRGGGQVELERVVLRANHDSGAEAREAGTALSLSDAAVVDTAGRESDQRGGYGLFLLGGVSADLRRIVVESNHHGGLVVAERGTSVTLENAVVGGTEGQESDGTGGAGLIVAGGATIHVSRVRVELNRIGGIEVYDPGTVLGAADLLIRDTLGQESDGKWGSGLFVSGGAQADVARAVVERNRYVSVYVAWQRASAILEDVLVRDTECGEEPLGGPGAVGILAGQSATLRGSHLLLERNRQTGVQAANDGSSVDLRDVVVRDGLCEPEGAAIGSGLAVIDRASGVAARVLLERNLTYGVVSQDATLALEDVVVRDTLPHEHDGMAGEGLVAQARGVLELRRGLSERNRTAGVLAAGLQTTLAAQDLVVRDTLSQQSDASFGNGLEVSGGARAEVTRARLEGNRGLGLAAFDPGTNLDLADFEVSDTLPMDCWTTACVSGAAGSGVASLGGAQLQMTSFRVTGSALCGVQLAHGAYWNEQGEIIRYETGGTMDLHEGEVSNNVVGANVQTEGFDLHRLMDRVIYRDNGRNLDTNELPVPDMSLPPEWQEE